MTLWVVSGPESLRSAWGWFEHAKSADFDILRLQNELSEKLGSPIVIKHNANGSGKLIVKYFNNDQLEGIIQKMS